MLGSLMVSLHDWHLFPPVKIFCGSNAETNAFAPAVWVMGNAQGTFFNGIITGGFSSKWS
jgi:hypothetical protein